MAASISTPPPPPGKKVRPGRVVLFVVFFALCGACGVALASAGSHSSDSTTAQVKEMTAFDMCKQSVRAKLKAPSTAKFRDYFGDQAPTISGSGDGPYNIASTVDSQNGFGAMIRSTFLCTAIDRGGDQWSATSSIG
jgi:hypothetical protein